ncbi:MAG: hypothetical protein ACQEQM_01210 [Thermoplasmatota archaeon]
MKVEDELNDIKGRLETIERYLKLNAKENLEESIVKRLKKDYSKTVSDDPREKIKSYRDIDLKKEKGDYILNGEPVSQSQCFRLENEARELGFNNLDEVTELSKEERDKILDKKLDEWKEKPDRENKEHVKQRLEELIEEKFFNLNDSNNLMDLMDQYESVINRLKKLEKKL